MLLPPDPFRLQISLFEGTLGQLIQMSRKDDVDLLDIALVGLVEQVMDFLFQGGAMRLDLDLAGSYLFDMACLVEMKSRKLLPKTQVESFTEDEEEEFTEEELEKRLARRLLDYAKYRNVAEGLRTKEEIQSKLFFKLEPKDPTHKETLLEEVSLYDMLHVLRRLLERAPKVRTLEVMRETLSVEDAMTGVLDKIKIRIEGPTRFEDLFTPESTKNEIVITFLAILELIFRRFVVLRQDDPYGDILVSLRPEDPPEAADEPVAQPEETTTNPEELP